jgi:hypothetical protein
MGRVLSDSEALRFVGAVGVLILTRNTAVVVSGVLQKQETVGQYPNVHYL